MKRVFISLFALLALVACSELMPETPNNGNEGDNNGNTEQPENPSDDPTDDPSEPAKSSFAITIEELHATRAITQVLPENMQMHYVMYLEEVAYLQGGAIDTQEKLWQDDFEAFERQAASANMSLKEYMQQANILFSGTQRVQWNNVLPGIKSVLYVYGVQFNENGSAYEAVTDVAWKVIEPERAPLQDIKFDLQVDVDGADVVVTIDPKEFTGHYLVKIVDVNNDLYPHDDAAFTEEYMDYICDEWTYLYDGNLDNGHKKEDILKQVCYSGRGSLSFELDSYVLYSVLVYPVEEYDGFMQIVAKPSYYNFSTEEVQQSDMEINIEVTNCYVRVADLRVTSTDPEAQYLLMITPTYYLPDNYTDETLMEYALGTFYSYTYTFKGEMTSHLNTLYPSTEYVVVTFGYSGGVVTTDVYSKVFTTEAEGECELEVTDVVVGGPYRPSDLYNYDPETFKYYTKPYYYDSSQFIVTIEVKTSEPTKDIFSYFVSKDDYDWCGYDTIFYDLLIDTCDPFTIGEGFWDYGAYYLCAAAFDYKGNVTPMYISELYDWTMDDIRPISEFIEKWEAANQNLQVMSLSAVR